MHAARPQRARVAALALGVALAACLAPKLKPSDASSQPPASAAPNRSSRLGPPNAVASAPPAPDSAARRPVPADDPKDCVDPVDADDIALRDKLRVLLAPLLSKVSHCTDAMQSDDVQYAEVSFYARNHVITRARVDRSSFRDCAPLTCAMRALVGLREPPKLPGQQPGSEPTYDLEFRRGHVEPALATTAQQVVHDSCADKPDPADPPAPKPLIAPETIQQLIGAQYGKFRACYDAALGRNREAAGRISVRITIRPDGGVASASVIDNTLPDCEAVRCVRDGYKSAKFPAPGGNVTVSYPVEFSPNPP